MTTRQKKPWHDEASCRRAESDWAERKTRMAIREGWKCGYCGFSPEGQSEEIKHELLRQHMRAHLHDEGDQSDKWQHPTGFDHRGRIEPKGNKP